MNPVADQLKIEGNKLYQQKQYNESVKKYTKAIELESNNAIFYANRAAAFISLKLYPEAENDSKRCIDLNPNYMKGYIRLALTYQKQSKYKEAIKKYQFILHYFSNLTPTQTKYVMKQIKICESNLYKFVSHILTTNKKRKLFPKFKLTGKISKFICVHTKYKNIQKLFDSACTFEYSLKKYDVSSEIYRYLANLNHIGAIQNYALWYLYGNRSGVSKNLQKAYELFEYVLFLDPKQGFSLFNLSTFYFDGNVVNKDFKIAFQLCKKSVEDPQMRDVFNHFQCYKRLGDMYIGGMGTNRNIKLGEKYTKIANEIRYPNDEKLPFIDLLKQLHNDGGQRELDKRWDTMCAYMEMYEKERINKLQLEKNAKYIYTVRENVNIMKLCGFNVLGYNDTAMGDIKCINGMVSDFKDLGLIYNVNPDFDWNNCPIKPTRICGDCGLSIRGKRVYLCSNCEQAYCSKKCQKKDWASHKQQCQMVKDNAGFI